MSVIPEGIHISESADTIDDLTANAVASVRLERMADDHYWLAIYTTSGERLVVNLRSELEILAHWAPNL